MCKGQRIFKICRILFLTVLLFLGIWFWKGELVCGQELDLETGEKPWMEQSEITLIPKKNQNIESDMTYYDAGVEGYFWVSEMYLVKGKLKIYAKPLDQRAKQIVEASGGEKEWLEIGEWNAEETEDGGRKKVSFSFNQQGRWKIYWKGKVWEKETVFYAKGNSKEFTIDHISPQIQVLYTEYSSISSAESSSQNVNRKIDRGLKRIVSSECELFSKEKILVEIRIKEDYFSSEKVKIQWKERRKGEDFWRDFSEKGENFFWDEKEKRYSFVFVIEKEGHYQFQIEYEDEAGNALKAEAHGETENCFREGKYISPILTIDKTAPVLKIKIQDEGEAKTWEGKTYFTRPISILIEIEEENFNKQDFSLRHSLTWADGTWISPILDQNAYEIVWEKKYEKRKNVYTANILVEQEANHTFVAQVQDGCGQCSQVQERKCTYDKTKPEVYLKIHTEGSFFPKASYSYFSSEKIKITIIAKDAISGVKHISCLGEESGDIWKFERKEDIRNVKDIGSDVSSYEATIVLEKDSWKGRIIVQAEDLCGIQSEKVKSPGMVLEKKETHDITNQLSLELSEADYVDEEKRIKYYRNPLHVKVKAMDSYSGIRSMQLKAGEKKKEKQEDPYNIKYQDSLMLEVKGEENLESNPQKPIKVEAKFLDYAGNQSEIKYQEYKIVVDHKKPEIFVQYDKQNGRTGSYYNQKRVATVTVKDWNFNPDSVKWMISGSNSNYHIGQWTGETGIYQCKVEFFMDGENYKMQLSAADYAGNETLWDEDQAFTIDQTPPVLKMEMDKGDVSNGYYYRRPKEVLFTVTEKNMDRVKTFYWDKKHRNVRKQLEWKPKGKDRYVSSVVFDEDGEYAICFQCMDLAGNFFKMTRPMSFIIDSTIPQIEVSGITQGMAYGGEVSPMVAVKDKNIDSKSIEIKLERADGSENRVPEGKKKKQVHGQTVFWESFARKKEMDGIYRLKVFVKDLAGNCGSLGEGMVFFVDRFGASYQVGKKWESLTNKGYINKERDLVITEQSVIPVDTVVTIVRENQEQTAMFSDMGEKEKKTWYVVEEEKRKKNLNGKRGWIVRKHYIKKKNFEREGLYQVTLQSRGYTKKEGKKKWINRTNNEAKGDRILFTVDKTSPVVRISGLEEKYYKKRVQPFVITVMDNYAFSYMDLRIHYEGGWKADWIQRIYPEDLNEQHSYMEELQAYNGVQTISWRAWDAAGNCMNSEAQGESISCVVTENQVVQAYHKNVVFYYKILGIAVGCFLLLGVGVIFYKKFQRKHG